MLLLPSERGGDGERIRGMEEEREGEKEKERMGVGGGRDEGGGGRRVGKREIRGS